MNFIDLILAITSDPNSKLAKQVLKILTDTNTPLKENANKLFKLLNANGYNIDINECIKILKARENIGKLIAGNLKY